MSNKQFLSKLNKIDYNNVLEEVLEGKPYTEDVKSLLLSMLYKIEISYNDYAKVKRNVMPINDFIVLLISTIKFCCNQIKLVEPNSEIGLSMNGKKAKVENNDIIAFPTEYALLNGIAEVIPEDFIFDCILEEEAKKMLRIGFVSEITEIISDYDGWTWNISEISLCTLLYRNMKYILGNDFLEEWRNGKINLKNVKDRIFNLYNGEIQQKIINEMNKIIAKQFVVDYPEKSAVYLEKLKKLRNEFEIIDNTADFIAKVSLKKSGINKKINEIDKLLLSDELLKQKYQDENEKRPLEKRIFSVRHYRQLLKEEREKLYKSLLKCNREIEPAILLGKKELLKNEIKKYEIIENAINDDISFEKLSIDFQKIFLKILEIKTERATTKGELIDLIYILRYYKNTKVKDYIKEYNDIKENINVFEKELLLKSINSNVFVKFTNDQLVNVQIISNILDTKIIELEEINIIPKISDNSVVLEIYDGEVLDNTLKLGKTVKNIELKQNKKNKLLAKN